MLFLNILGLCLLSIIFQAEPQLEPAWGNCEFWGRVRVSDGLIVLIQHVVRYHHATSHCRMDPFKLLLSSSNSFACSWTLTAGGTVAKSVRDTVSCPPFLALVKCELIRVRACLSLYVTVLSSQNFVGKWKYCSPGSQWEGIWSLNKVE